MPRIKEYTAADRELSQDSTGFAAFETAGRRIGPAYEQAATSYAKIGRTQADDIKGRIWPWDILALDDQQKSGGSSSKGGKGSGGGGLKLEGGANNLYNEKEGGGSGSGGALGSSRGAAALGKIGSGLASNGKYYSGDYSTETGLPVGKSKYDYVLDQGELVRVGGKGAGDINGQGAAQKWGDERAGVPFDTSTGFTKTPDPSLGTEIAKEELDRGLNPVGEMTGDSTNSSSGWWSGVTDWLSGQFKPNTSSTDDGSTDE